MGEDYIRTARAKGLGERRVIFRHGVRAAITPIVTVARPRHRHPRRRRDPHRDRLQHPGHRPAGLRRDPARRPVDVQGTMLFGAFVVMHHEPARGHPVRLPRPAGALLMAEPLLEVRDLARPLRHRRRRRQGGRRHLLRRRRAARRSGSSASRARASRVSLADRDGADALEQRADPRRDPVRRASDLLQASDDEMRDDPRRGDRDDLPGPAVVAASLLPIGDQLVEAVRAHHDVSKQRRATTGGGDARLVGIPEPQRAASTATRTSSPAACASA